MDQGVFKDPETDRNRKRLAQLFPTLSETELREAELDLRLYFDVVQRIYEHVRTQDPKILTELRRRARLRVERRRKRMDKRLFATSNGINPTT